MPESWVVEILYSKRGPSLLLDYLLKIDASCIPKDDTTTVSLSINESHAYKSMIFRDSEYKCMGISVCYKLLSELDGWVHEADEITSLRIVERPIVGFEETVIATLL